MEQIGAVMYRLEHEDGMTPRELEKVQQQLVKQKERIERSRLVALRVVIFLDSTFDAL